jgi:superfamily II DNA or RNA helicase
MSYVPYEWQNRFLNIYKGNGVVKAFAGTGKTYAAILLLIKRKYRKIIIAVPTRKLKNQWNEELKKYEVKNTFVETFHMLSKQKSKGLKCDILIVDECHRSISPVFKKLYSNILYKHILGLSATPNNECLNYCGNIIIEIPIEEAQICDFKVYFHAINLNYDEKEEYDEYSKAISRYLGRLRSKFGNNKVMIRQKLDSLIFKRRSLVYMAESRIPKAVELINKNNDKPTLLICKRIEQANIISKITGYPAYHSENPDEKSLNDFHYDRIPVLISVGMLAEGYDKRNIKCLIIVSTAITEAYHIQSIGRAVRLPDDADIHILLARKTTDEKLLQFRHMYKHEIVGEFSRQALKPANPWIEQYYLSDEYSFDLDGKIFQITSEGKQYFKDNSIKFSLDRLFNYHSGKFRITQDNLVLAKRGGKIIIIGILQEPLQKITPTTIKPQQWN